MPFWPFKINLSLHEIIQTKVSKKYLNKGRKQQKLNNLQSHTHYPANSSSRATNFPWRYLHALARTRAIMQIQTRGNDTPKLHASPDESSSIKKEKTLLSNRQFAAGSITSCARHISGESIRYSLAASANDREARTFHLRRGSRRRACMYRGRKKMSEESSCDVDGRRTDTRKIFASARDKGVYIAYSWTCFGGNRAPLVRPSSTADYSYSLACGVRADLFWETDVFTLMCEAKSARVRGLCVNGGVVVVSPGSCCAIFKFLC